MEAKNTLENTGGCEECVGRGGWIGGGGDLKGSKLF